MDPNSNLRETRETIAEINRCHDLDHPYPECSCISKADRLAELAEALDGWLSRGGFLPADWGKGR